MRFFFSGIAGESERQMLIDAGVTEVLVDQFDTKHATGFEAVALDSGAYRVWKRGGVLDIDAYLQVVASREWVFAVAPDVIGDEAGTLDNWQKVKHDPCILPVWHWGSTEDTLKRYLDDRALVCIGALVPLMREKDKEMLANLTELCEKYPNRFHILGMNWLKAIEALKELVYSADSSKFLDGGRYGECIFVHSRTGHLQQCAAGILKTVNSADGIPYPELDRKGRCVESARNMLAFVRM